MRVLSRPIILTVTFLIASGALLGPAPAISAEEKPPVQVLFTNVNVFDGKSDKLALGMSVLIEGNLIKQIGKGLKPGEGATVIDGGGRTLMPGLIDGHAHMMINQDFPVIETNLDITDLAYNAVIVAERFLMPMPVSDDR